MTTLCQVEYQCPVCEHAFRSQKVVSTNSFGGKRTDFHERAAGAQPLPHLVQTCWECGFAASDAVFESAEERGDITGMVREQLLEAMPKWRGRTLTGSEKYEAAAEAAEILGGGDRVIADYLLRAAWCCVDENDTEAERYFRIKAAERFQTALASFDGIEQLERAVVTYLTGELWRRSGHQARALEWFEKVPNEIVDNPTQRWIVDAAIQQGTAPREWWG
jgi:uncharacterized protein (DUF2225 family)